MRIYSVEPELDKKGDAVCDAGDDTVYISRKTFEELADAFGLAVIRMPKATLGWDADGLCDDHNRFGCKECALTPPSPAGADDGIA